VPPLWAKPLMFPGPGNASGGRVRIWHKHESMDPSCLVSTVQAGGGG